jgi:preprotein translocase subunit YajC
MVETQNTQTESSVMVYAQDAPSTGSPLGGLFPIIMMFGIFWFVLLRPQSKERKAHEAMVAALQKGDKVVTKSGVHGRIGEVGDNTVDLEIADKVRITVDKMSVARKGEQG